MWPFKEKKLIITPHITYLIYIILWEGFVIGGCAYIVFWRGFSAWWFLLAVILSGAAYKPSEWSSLLGEQMIATTTKGGNMMYSLTIKPSIPVEMRHKIADFLEVEGYNVIGYGQNIIPPDQCDISFEDKVEEENASLRSQEG